MDSGRVQVIVPAIANGEKAWMPRVYPTSDNRQQRTWLAQNGDAVLVAFENGDVSYPYVLGFLWSGSKKPPQ